MANYVIERDGQIDFFNNYGIPYEEDNSVLIDNTDGVFNGNILEFKLNINDLNKVLFQAIKYLSRMRIKGEDVPATILLIDLNDEKVYQYKSLDYKEYIQKIYTGSASKNNEGFSANEPAFVYDYSKSNDNYMVDSSKIKKLLISEKDISDMFMPIDINEDCIVGWAERYYKELPKATKGDFLGDETGTAISVTGEIRNPRHFKGRINPYIGASNEKFKYLMDCLNSRLSKKDLGAFYTPILYAKKAAELVKIAVQRALEAGKNDYIILDRCAGTGNLESALIDLTDINGDSLISHCIVSTYEYYEYKVLNERIGDKVREIIPPTEADVVFENGNVSNADAMSEEYINNPIIKDYIDDENCAIIIFENPPFRDTTSGMTGVKSGGKKTNSYVLSKMFDSKVSSTNELANHFIWSAFEIYMRQDTDSCIIFSPLKYWKLDRLVNNKVIGGYIFNRDFFHASASAVGCVLFSKETDLQTEKLLLDVYDIKNNQLVFVKKQPVIRARKTISDIFDKHADDSDVMTPYACAGDGSLKIMSGNVVNHNKNIVGYIVGRGFGISNPNLNFSLLRTMFYDKHGFYIRKSNYKNYLPILAIKHYLMFERPWYETELVCCSTDKGTLFMNDEQFIKSCFIFSMLDYYNKCCSIELPNNQLLKNELCFDMGTVAFSDLEKFDLDKDEMELIDLWNKILKEARDTGKCNSNWTYGVYQITKEINTFVEIGTGKNKKRVYDYPQLNGDLDTLRIKLKEYYKTHITEKMFEYELLK